MKKFKRVEIEWFDHWTQAGWKHLSDIDKSVCVPTTNKTIGYLIRSEPAGVLIASTYDTAGDLVSTLSFRCRSLIKRIRVLKG